MTLSDTADSYVRDGSYAAQNFGQVTPLEVKNVTAPGYSRQAYLSFDLSGVASADQITSAKVRLFGNLLNTAAPSIALGLYPVATSWTESGLTWNNKPAPGTTAAATGTVTGATAKWYEFDVTNSLKQQKLAGAASVAFAIKGTATGEGWAGFNSDEASTNKPQLVVAQGTSPTPTPSPSPTPTLAGLTLVNAASDQDIGTLADGQSIDLTSTGPSLSVRANPSTGVGSVVFNLDGSYSHTESDQPFSLAGDNVGDYTPATLSVGSHTLTVTPYSGTGATGTIGTATTVHFTVTQSTATGFSAHVNFQPAGAAVPSGYVADTGAVYGSRGNGLTYGWAVANPYAVDRNSSLSKDQRYDTVAYFQKTNTPAVWEVAVPNGSYQVHIVSGDPSWTGDTQRVNVEGALAVNFTTNSTTRWVEGTVTATVTDGRLTVTPASGAVNAKIDYIDITPVTNVKTPLGGSLNEESDRITSHAFVDLVKSTLGFYNLAGRTTAGGVQDLATTDADGWPTEDFAVAVADNSEFTASVDPGVYPMSFTGPAGVTVSVRASAPAGAAVPPVGTPVPTLTPLSYDAATGTYTYDVNVPSGAQVIAFDFTNTGGQVKDLKVLQPGYALGTTQTFTNDYLNFLSNLGPNVLRFMDFTNTNNSQVADWSQRSLPTDATMGRVANAGDLHPAKGVAWEYVIELANTLHVNPWINVPAHATDDYVTQLAALLQSKLDPTLTVYVEYSNEVWNTGFEQATYNTAQATAEVQSNPNSNLKYDGKTDATTVADRRYARRSIEIGNILRAALGTSRVRSILASQLANPSRFDNMLKYVTDVYGAPSNYFYAIGVAPYINLGSQQNTPGLTTDQVLADLSASVDGYQNGTSLTSAKTRATNAGLKLVAYEGGIDTFGDASITAKAAASLDPRIQPIMTRYLNVWYADGGDQFNWYTLGARSYNSPYGTYSISDNIHNLNEPKEIAYRSVRDAGLGS